MARVKVTLKMKGDPGYGGTAKMIAETALCIALDKPKADKEKSLYGSFKTLDGGVLTCASGLGQLLVDRLTQTGVFDIQVEDFE